MNAEQTPAPGPAEVWRNGTAAQRQKVWSAFPALGQALGRDAVMAKIISVWRCGTGSNYTPIAEHFPALFEAMCRADDSGRAEPYRPAPETITAPAPSGEFRGLSHVVDVWRAGNREQRNTVGRIFPAMAMILDRADKYVQEIDAQQVVNECSPAPADDREPTHTVAMLDDLLRAATGGYGQSPAELYGCGDWLNLAVHFAADAVTEKATLTGSTGSAAMIARNNCAAATAMATMFAILARAAVAVEGVRRDG